MANHPAEHRGVGSPALTGGPPPPAPALRSGPSPLHADRGSAYIP